MEELLWLVGFADDDDRELTTYEVAHALGAGLIDLETLVWRDGMAEWHALADVPELASVVERHRAMGLALKKRQTVLGGFQASPSTEPLHPLHPLPPMPAPPGASQALPADPELTGPSNSKAAPLDSSPEAEPPTLRPSAPSFEGLLGDKTPPGGVPFGAVDLRRSLGGFKPVPVRRGFSGGGSLPGDDFDDEGTPSSPNYSAPNNSAPDNARIAEDEGQAASVDSEGFLRIPSAELHTQPHTEFDDEQTSDEGASFARLGARELSFSPRAEPSTPSADRVDEDALLSEALQAPRVPVFGKDRVVDAATEQPVEVLPRRPRPKPPLLDKHDGPARTIPPGFGVATGHVDTDGTAVMSPVNPTLPPPGLSPNKRWFLGGMAAIALGAVSFLTVHSFEQDDSAPSAKSSGVHAKAPTRTFAVQPASPDVAKPPQPDQALALDKQAETKPTAAAFSANRAAKTAASLAAVEKPSTVKQPKSEAEVTPAEATPAIAAAASASEPALEVSAATGPGPFDRDAATNALEQAASEASSCRKGSDPSGIARVSVTFSDSGKATLATVDGPPFAGTATGGCIADVMRGARIPAFAGERITVKKTVVIQ
jgi:GYF domain 2